MSKENELVKSLPLTDAEREFAANYYRRLAIGLLTLLTGYTTLIGAVVAAESAGIRVSPDQINAAVAVVSLGGSVPAIIGAIIG